MSTTSSGATRPTTLSGAIRQVGRRKIDRSKGETFSSVLLLVSPVLLLVSPALL
jgi:hypothetical protein